MYTYREVEQKLNELIAADCEPEIEVKIKGIYYMIIGYEEFVTFQRCGNPGSGEIRFSSWRELYHATTIDGICLERDWGQIEEMYSHEFEDMETLLMLYSLKNGHGIRRRNGRQKKNITK